MNNLKGQTVHMVTMFNRDDIVQSVELYSDAASANEAVKKYNLRGRKYGDYAYTDTTTIR